MGVVEVEARFRLCSPVDVPATLATLGIDVGDPARQDDQAYAPHGWAYGDDRIAVTFARLRTEGERHLFTVKRPVSDVRTCIEHECHVSDRDAMHEAILLMGFRPTVRIVKTRRSARIDDRTALCVDHVDGVGSFIEVETLAGPADDHERLRTELSLLVERLDLDVEPCTDTYDTLVHAATTA